MILTKLKLNNFRNYQNLEINFTNGVNYILGENASGKTNLVEAIYFLSITRSFKTSNPIDLIKNNENYFYINGELLNNNYQNNLEIYFDKIGKKIKINKTKIDKISELSKYVNVLVFTPKDTFLLKEPPKTRRFFLNLNISKTYKEYTSCLINYEKILKERNLILKNKDVNKIYLNTLTKQLIKYSKEIYLYRKKYIDELNKQIDYVYKNLDMKNNYINIKYLSFINDFENYENIAIKKYQESLTNDINKQVTNIGVHKEDFLIELQNKDVGKYGSQGENRLVTLSLILSNYFINSEFDIKPIVILDDVLSELDNYHEELLIKFLKEFEQVFITGTKENILLKNNCYQISNNLIERRY